MSTRMYCLSVGVQMASFMATAAHVRMEEIIHEGNIVRWIVKPQPSQNACCMPGSISIQTQYIVLLACCWETTVFNYQMQLLESSQCEEQRIYLCILDRLNWSHVEKEKENIRQTPWIAGVNYHQVEFDRLSTKSLLMVFYLKNYVYDYNF